MVLAGYIQDNPATMVAKENRVKFSMFNAATKSIAIDGIVIRESLIDLIIASILPPK